MIAKVTGRLAALEDDHALVAAGAFEYVVLVPEFARRQLQGRVGEEVSLHTLHYIEAGPNQGRMIPRLIGFIHPIEREFFELFCSVDGVGARKALRAMVRPVAEVAGMIEDQDAKALSTLPGVGAATAERVVAKLRRKMPKFALLAARETPGAAAPDRSLFDETFEVLLTLGHGESEARALLEKASQTKSKFKDVQELLQVIYQQRRG